MNAEVDSGSLFSAEISPERRMVSPLCADAAARINSSYDDTGPKDCAKAEEQEKNTIHKAKENAHIRLIVNRKTPFTSGCTCQCALPQAITYYSTLHESEQAAHKDSHFGRLTSLKNCKKKTEKVKKGVDKDRQGVYNTSSRHERGT